jgi:hypothetical protein
MMLILDVDKYSEYGSVMPRRAGGRTSRIAPSRAAAAAARRTDRSRRHASGGRLLSAAEDELREPRRIESQVSEWQ